MQKSKERQKNFVNCRGTSKTYNKGITLIALIVTIIVMLILVGVTINVALDGNLFEIARTAATQTEEQVIYDQIVGAMALESSGEINVSETYSSMKSTLEEQGKTVNLINPSSEQEITNSAVVEVIGNNGTYTYTITRAETVVGEIKENEFYGYAYVWDSTPDESICYRFLENGIIIGFMPGKQFVDEKTIFRFVHKRRSENFLV